MNTLKIRLMGMFILFTFLSGVSLYLKMKFYPHFLGVLGLAFLDFRLNTVMVELNVSLIRKILLLLFSLLVIFWNDYLISNIIAYVISIGLVWIYYIAYLSACEIYIFFRGYIPQRKALEALRSHFYAITGVSVLGFLISIFL